jgi:hypothetical protein
MRRKVFDDDRTIITGVNAGRGKGKLEVEGDRVEELRIGVQIGKESVGVGAAGVGDGPGAKKRLWSRMGVSWRVVEASLTRAQAMPGWVEAPERMLFITTAV